MWTLLFLVWSCLADTLWLPYLYYTPETRIAGGLLTIHRFGEMKKGRASNIRAYGTYTQNQQTIFYFSPQYYFDQHRNRLDFSTFYLDFPQYFYGLGNDTSYDRRALYDVLSQTNQVSLTRNYYSNFFYTFGIAHYHRKIRNIDEDDEEPELAAVLRAIEPEVYSTRTQLGVSWDRRDFPQSPTEGEFYELTHYLGFANSESWHRFDLDLRKYFSFGEKQRLATQVYVAMMESKDTPVDSLIALGGARKMRGYYAGRLRGRAALVMQLEWRKEFWDKYGYSAFYNLGHVQLQPDKFLTGRYYSSIGGGLHYFIDSEARTKARLDIGFGDEGPSLYVVMDDAF